MITYIKKLMMELIPNQSTLSPQAISRIKAHASMNVSSTTTTITITPSKPRTTSTTWKQYHYNEKRYHIVGWANSDVNVLQRNDKLLEQLLDADIPTESKRESRSRSFWTPLLLPIPVASNKKESTVSSHPCTTMLVAYNIIHSLSSSEILTVGKRKSWEEV